MAKKVQDLSTGFVRRHLSNMGYMARMFIEAAPLQSAILLLGTTAFGLAPAVQSYLFKSVVDVAVSDLAEDAKIRAVLWLALAVGAMHAGQAALQPFLDVARGIVNDRLTNRVNSAVLQKGIEIKGIGPFESPSYYDTIEVVAARAGYVPMNVLQRLTYTWLNGTTLLGLLAISGLLHPLLPVMLLASTIPVGLHSNRAWRLQWETEERLAEDGRKADYLFDVAVSQNTAKEVRLYDLGEWLAGRYKEQMGKVERAFWDLRKRMMAMISALSFVSVAGMGGALSYVVWRGAAGSLTPGDLVLYMGVLISLRVQVESLIAQVSALPRLTEAIEKIRAFLAAPPDLALPDHAKAITPNPSLQTGLELRDVHFAYPGGEEKVLAGVSFAVRPGESVALVGANGVGKTTIVKLITRLYDPVEGEVLLDGEDLRRYDIDEVRRRIAVVFQDFSQYGLTLGQNIGLGDIDRLDDPNRIIWAAKQGGADAVAAKLPNRYDTRLTRAFGETDLSGGEWQRVALSRAFMRDAVLILDEPTASLDVRVEHDVYRRFSELTKGKTTILISHRFSTVRMADRIIVVEDGRVCEEGSHEELMARSGRYAEMYTLQAAGYLDDSGGPAGRSDADAASGAEGQGRAPA